MAVAGAALYFAGIVNSIILEHPGLVVLAIAIAIAILLACLIGTGRDDATAPMPGRTWFVRGTWGFVCVMALVSFAWLVGMPRQHSLDWTPYHNDAIALNECAARLVLQGRDPYTDLDVFACYQSLGIGPDRTTPLRSGAFANVAIYPSDDQMDQVWDERANGIGTNEEFVWRPSYPAVSFLALLPVVALGWDTNYLYVACLLVAMALVVARAPRTLRPFFLTALFGAASLAAFTVGGSSDLLYALPLVVAWMYRERKWAAIPFGIALATKQIAWFFAPFWIIAVGTERGWRAAAGDAAIAAGVFAVTNLPFIVHDPQAWVAGILTPLVEPMFARGAGTNAASSDTTVTSVAMTKMRMTCLPSQAVAGLLRTRVGLHEWRTAALAGRRVLRGRGRRRHHLSRRRVADPADESRARRGPGDRSALLRVAKPLLLLLPAAALRPRGRRAHAPWPARVRASAKAWRADHLRRALAVVGLGAAGSRGFGARRARRPGGGTRRLRPAALTRSGLASRGGARARCPGGR